MEIKNYYKVYDSKTADVVVHVDRKLLYCLGLKELPQNGKQLSKFIYNSIILSHEQDMWDRKRREALFN